MHHFQCTIAIPWVTFTIHNYAKNIRLYFAYNFAMSMHYTQLQGPFPTNWVVCCKLCRRNVPAGVETFPRDNTVVRCPLCGEIRRYRPSEVFLGWKDSLIEQQMGTNRFRPYNRKPPQRFED